MIRHFYISDDLNDLVAIEQELNTQGFSKAQIHVLSERDADVYEHQLPEVESVLKKDVVRSTEIGALVGFSLASLTLLISYTMGWTQSQAGWLPFVFLSIVILGFCTWEGGLIGIQTPNKNFSKFQSILKKGKHLLFVDLEPSQEPLLSQVVATHPKLEDAGHGYGAPSGVVKSRDCYQSIMKTMP